MFRAVRRHLSTRAREAPESGDRGFVLLEEIVSITLLMIVMAALATFFLTVVQSTTYERARQTAVQLANSQLDAVNAVNAGDLFLGRTATAVSQQFSSAPPAVQAALRTTQQNYDTTTPTSTLTLPMTTTAVVNNTTYTITNYLGNCWIPTLATLGTDCTTTSAAQAAGTSYDRAVISVTWPGSHCPQVNGAGLCTYVTSSLLSGSSDPTFNLCTQGAACGPAQPQVVNPGNQYTLVGTTVSLQLSLVPYTGVAPITWSAGGLPSWLSLNPSTGLITGTAPPTAVAAVLVTVTATDAFARTAQVAFTWSVVNPPTITGLTTPYTATAGVAIASQTLPYTCPTSSCTYSLTGAPGGIGLATSSGGTGAATQTVANTSGNLYLVGTVPSSVLPASTAYAADVANQGASNYWRLDETSGSTGADSIPGSTNSPLTELPGVGHGAAGALLTTADAASAFDGAADGVASTTTPVVGPQTFSEEIWFRTTTTSGGKLIGFGDQSSGLSGTYDRQLYMDNAGHLVFGVYNNGTNTVATTTTYNDGRWHQAVATVSGAGTTLSVDGATMAANSSFTTAQAFSGFWKIGGDSLGGWPGQPSSNYFAGALDEASIYPTALTPAQIQQQYSDSGRVPFTLTITPTDQLSGASGVVDQAAWTVVPSALPTITGLTTPFVTTAGASITSQPLPYTCGSSSCSYTLAGAPSGIGLALTANGVGQASQTVVSSSGTLYAVGTVAGSVAPAATAYAADVRSQGATNYWRLDEASGSTAPDSIGSNNLLEQSGVGHGVAGGILSNPDTADTFDGSTAGYAATQNQVPAPGDFSESIWFRTQTNQGGKLIGFASSNSSPSVANDRHIYLDNAGHLFFGTWSNGPQVIATSGTYNDGQWHQAVGTYSVAGGGMSFYVDGVLIGTNSANIPYQQAGYWRVGGDTLSSATWPGTYSSTYFQGTLDDASIYAKALTAAQIQQQYADSGRVPFTLTATPRDLVTGVTGLANQASWTVYSPPTVTGLTTPFITAAGATITAQSLPYNCPLSACTLTLTGAPAGIGLSTTAGGTGSGSVAVTANTGTVYLVGTTAATVRPGTFNLSVTPTDSASGVSGTAATAVWTVGGVTVSGLTNPFTTTVGATLSQTLAFTCPSLSCSFTVSGAPAGIGLDSDNIGAVTSTLTVTGANGGALYLRGTVASTVTPGTYTVIVTPRDTVNNVTGTAVQATWTVYAAPTVNGLVTPFTTTAGAVLVSQPLPYTCPSGSCTYTLAGSPAGVGLNLDNGTAVASSVTVTGSTSGNLYLRGTIASTAAPSSTAYATDVRNQGASNYWRLGEASGTTGVDSIGTLPLTEQAGVGHGVGGGITSSSDTASTFDGSPVDGSASTQALTTNPQTFSESVWFNTTTTRGGWIVGFANTITGISNLYDRQIYMDNSGHLDFGTCGVGCNGNPSVVTTSGTYNDGRWHQAVGTLSSSGLSLYVDGSLIATNPAVTTAYVQNGYWRLGGNNLSAWPGTVSSQYFAGTLDEVSIYPAALTAAQIAQQWADAHASSYSVSVTPTDTTSTVSGIVNSAAWTVNPPPAVSGLTSPLSTTVGSTLSQAISYRCPSLSCSYTVTGAPAGIGLDTDNVGAVAGTVTVTGSNAGTIYLRGTVAGTATAGPYTVVLTPRDTTTGVTGTPVQGTWTVYAAPTVNGLVTPFTTTAGAVLVSQPLPYTCPSGSCTYTLVGAPAGVGLNLDNGTAVSASVTVTGSTSGNLYLRGTVAATVAPSSTAYATDVRNQGASNYWRLGEASGSTGVDSVGSLPLAEQAGVGHGVGGGIASSSDTASTFDGSSVDGYASTQTAITGPQVFSESVWFNTTTTSGGRLLGFSNQTTGTSTNYDRQIYLDNTGHLYFGTCGVGCNGVPAVVSTPGAYNDGQWHQAVGTLSSAGMSFYVDGKLIATNAAVTTAQVFNGYWRLGGDNLGAWPGAVSSQYLAGTLDEVSIYPAALTAAQIAQQYADSGRVPFSVTVTPTDTASGIQGVVNQAAWTVYSPPVVTGLTTPFAVTAGATVANQTLPYSCPSGLCTFALTGAPAGVGVSTTSTGTVSTTVSVTAPSGVLYLRGTVNASAATGPAAVALTPTDVLTGVVGTAAQAAWTVAAGPSTSGLPSGFGLTVGEVVPNVPVSYTCPSARCTLALNSTAPAGLVLATGTGGGSATSVSVTATSGTVYVSGTIGSSATLGPYTVSVIPTDTVSGAVGVATTGTGTIYAAPTVSGQTNPLTTSVGATIANEALTYTCLSGSCTFTVANAPSGIGLYAGATATPPTNAVTSVTVAATSGTIYLRGTILASTAVGSSTVTVTPTATDPASGINTNGPVSSGAWTLVAAMSIGSPGTLTTNRPAVVSKSFTYTCRISSCTVSVAGAPAGIGLSATAVGVANSSVTVAAGSGTLYLEGILSALTPSGSYPITLTMTDPAGSTVTTAVTWTVS